MSDDRFERDEAGQDDQGSMPDPTIKQRINSLLVATWPRWWSPHEMEIAVPVRRTPRAMREMLAEDRARPFEQRLYEEKEVENTSTGKGKHKVYRALIHKAPPTLF
jgi:hypothetical protein